MYVFIVLGGVFIVIGLLRLLNRWRYRVLILLFLFPFISLPYFLSNRCNSVPGNAKQFLGTIAKNQEAYMAEFNTYADSCEKLKVIVKNDRNCYNYKIELSPDKKSYTATAWSKAPGIVCDGEGDDVWTFNEKLEMKRVENACNGGRSSEKKYIAKVQDISCIREDSNCSSCSDEYAPLRRYFIYAFVFIIVCIIYDLFTTWVSKHLKI